MKGINILLASVLILQAGCRGWIQKPIVPDTGIEIPRRGTLRVTKSDGTVVFLSDSFITSDSIVGFSHDAARARMAIARNNVSKIEVSGDTTPEGVRTAGKIYLGVVGAVAIVGMTLIAIALYGIGPQ